MTIPSIKRTLYTHYIYSLYIAIEAEKSGVEEYRDKLINDNKYIIDVDINNIQKQIISQSYILAQYKRQLQILNKKQITIDNNTNKIDNIIYINNNSKTNLLFEKQRLKEEHISQQQQIDILQNECNNIERESEELDHAYYKGILYL